MYNYSSFTTAISFNIRFSLFKEKQYWKMLKYLKDLYTCSYYLMKEQHALHSFMYFLQLELSVNF